MAVGWAYLLPPLSSGGASLAQPWLRFHIPLIEPDVRNERIRLSEKVSRCRPRETTRPRGEADEAQHLVQGGFGKPIEPSPDYFVFGT